MAIALGISSFCDDLRAINLKKLIQIKKLDAGLEQCAAEIVAVQIFATNSSISRFMATLPDEK